MNDPIKMPKHYRNHPSGVECIEIAQHFGFNLGNAIKYIWRCGEKGPALEDMQKARQYVRLERERLQKFPDSRTDDRFFEKRPDLYARRYEISQGCRYGGQALMTILSSSGMRGRTAATVLFTADRYLAEEIYKRQGDQPALPLETPKPPAPAVKGCDTCLHVDNASADEPCSTCLSIAHPHSMWESRD